MLERTHTFESKLERLRQRVTEKKKKLRKTNAEKRLQSRLRDLRIKAREEKEALVEKRKEIKIEEDEKFKRPIEESESEVRHLKSCTWYFIEYMRKYRL